MIRTTIEAAIQSGAMTKAAIAKARDKPVNHSTIQYDRFMRKVEDVESCLNELGFEINVTPFGGQ